MEKKEKWLKRPAFLALLLAGALAIGGTLAYLTAGSGELDNEFSFIDSDGQEGDMQVDIEEPGWEEDEALGLVPGDTIVKDPAVVNSSVVDIDQWVAMQVEVVKNKDGSVLSVWEMELFRQYFSIDFTTNGEMPPGTEGAATWTKLEETVPVTGLYYYNQKVPALDPSGIETRNNRTLPLFTKVAYSLDADNDVADVLKNEWGGFIIQVKAYAIQGDHIEWEDLPVIWSNTTA